MTLFFGYFIRANSQLDYCGYSENKKFLLKADAYTIKVVKLLCMLPLMLLSAFRYGIGTDYFNTYYYGYERVVAGDNYDNFEIGFKALILFLSKFFDNPQILFVVTSVLFAYFVYEAIFENSNDVFFSIFLLISMRFYFMSMNVVRQFVGMAIVLYATKYIFKKKYIKFVVFVTFVCITNSSISINNHISIYCVRCHLKNGILQFSKTFCTKI